MAVKIFNGLPYNLKEISNNPNMFRANLKTFCIRILSIHCRNFLKDDCIIFEQYSRGYY
jgi:hypothetical protein